jgi:5-methylcytosine-specific restriction endonuclease McrA
MEGAVPLDKSISQRHWERRLQRSQELRDELHADEAAEWTEHYEAHLASPEWQEIRERVLSRSRGICEGCRVNRATQVHHLTYQHMGSEFLWELVAICRDCHRRFHGRDS